MPTIMFTLEELAGPLITRTRELSQQVLDLSDLKVAPLDPGESPDARRHKIAKLGKQLAEMFQQLDVVMNAAASNVVGEPETTSAEPGTDVPKGTN